MESKLRAARKKMGLKQAEAAKKLGVSQSYFSLLEQGKRSLNDKLAKRAVILFKMSPTVLPLKNTLKYLPRATNRELVKNLSALKYPGYSHFKSSSLKNPAQVLFAALSASNLEGRLVEALPWVLLEFSDLEWKELVDAAKLRNLQNRLGFLTCLARKIAEKCGDKKKAEKFKRWENLLEDARLVKQDTLCRQNMTLSEKQWILQNRSDEAAHWNILSNLTPEYLYDIKK